MQLSRRQLAQTLAAAAASATLTAQAPQPTPQAASDAELAAARAQLRGAALAVRTVDLPMATEPATRFIPRT